MNAFEIVLASGIVVSFVAGSLAVAFIEWDRRRSQRRFRTEVQAMASWRASRERSMISQSSSELAMHARSGRISSISDAGDGVHSRISVTHGKKKRDKASGELAGYHRHESTVHIPTSDAKSYAIGDRVHSGLTPAGGGGVDPDGDEFDREPDTTEAGAIPGKSKGPPTPPKSLAKAPPAKALAKAGSKFTAAMGRK